MILTEHFNTAPYKREQNLEALDLRRAKRVVSHKTLVERLVRLRGLVEHARIDGGSQQVVGGADGMDIAREVEVELFLVSTMGDGVA